MIVDLEHILQNTVPVHQTRQALEKIINSPHEFHLTGSYFFENIKQGSDVDLFIKDDQPAYDFLKDVGFREKDCSKSTVSYLCMNTKILDTEFFEKFMQDEKYNRRNHIDPLVQRGLTGFYIDVMFIKPQYFKLRKFIQELMKKTGVLKESDKKSRTRTWIYTYSLIRSLEEYVG